MNLDYHLDVFYFNSIMQTKYFHHLILQYIQSNPNIIQTYCDQHERQIVFETDFNIARPFCGIAPRRYALIIDVARSASGVLRPRGPEDSSRRLNSRAMFEHGPKRHSYQLWEVKFQCPAMESMVETDQRLSKELARYILPSGGPSSPLSTAKEYSILRLVPDRPTFLLSLFIFVPVSLRSLVFSRRLFLSVPSLFLSLLFLPYKLN